MRLHSLDLLKYGKFTDARVTFPQAQHDFHLVVGPNEAGKSTIRAAVQDLLYGFPKSSPHAFIHLLPELCLAAMIGDGTNSLEFRRIKANSNTVRTPSGGILPDQDLAAFLGGSDRAFFRKMFGLDHGLMVEGGKSLLSAQNDVGQVLFQSAAGIAGLGTMRDDLAAQAGKLWAPKKAGDREYYIAQDKLAEATAALKAASLRAKVWAEAHDRVEQLAAARANEAALHQQMETKRNRLERLRRTAPHCAALREAEAQLAALGEVIDLPADAAARLAEAEKSLASAGLLLELHAGDVARMTATLAGIGIDNQVLAHADDIALLVQRRQQFSAHAHDIGQREHEVAALWSAVRDDVRQLGWQDAAEDVLRSRLPPLPIRRSLASSALEHSGLVQALQSARQAVQAKREEIEALTSQPDGSHDVAASPALRAALAAGRALGDTADKRSKLEAAFQDAQARLEKSSAALAPWLMSQAQLLCQRLISTASFTRLEQERQTLAADIRGAKRQLAIDEEECAKQERAVAQFARQHRPIDAERVTKARGDRDAAWRAMRDGSVPLPLGAVPFEAAMREADTLADMQLTQTGTAATLQELRHDLERKKDKAGHAAVRVDGIAADIDGFERRWQELAATAGLAGIALEVFPEWRAKREQVLEADAAHAAARMALEAAVQEDRAASAALQAALAEVGYPSGPLQTLAGLCELAEKFIHDTDAARIMRQARESQVRSSEIQAKGLDAAARAAEETLAAWTAKWSADLVKAGLAADTDVAAAKGALELVAAIDDRLEKISAIRRERIQTMQDDLAGLEHLATTLAKAVDPALVALPAAQIAQALQERLAKAVDARSAYDRQSTALEHARTQKKIAEEAIARANGELAPLLGRAGVTTTAELDRSVKASDAKAAINRVIGEHAERLVAAGDGATREQLDRELGAVEMAAVVAEIGMLQADLTSAIERQTALAAEHANAEHALAQMAGSDSAATAEAKRQEALAQMSDAAERFVRLATAARLLRWSIDKYRERKQGPMLARASAVFSALTLGAFQKLYVDFDQEPMALQGQRANGTLVGMDDMSEGTRDQVYFALRMAALELHLERAVPLPFIADDLFINYDDDRTRAGLQAMKHLSMHTQVIFLSHHAHLEEIVRDVFGQDVNVCRMDR